MDLRKICYLFWMITKGTLRMNKRNILSLCMTLFAITCIFSCKESPVATEKGEKAITAFGFVSPLIAGTIDQSAKTISVRVPEGTAIRSLTATFTITGVSVTIGSVPQVSGLTVNDFSSPLVYTVTAQDGSTADYTVTVTVATKKITAFSFPALSATGSIDEAKKTIAIAVPAATDLTALVAAFTTTGVSVKVGSMVQESGVTANDFTNPVTYTVTATDGTTADYRVSIIKSVPANWSAFDWTDSVVTPPEWLDRENMTSYCTVSNGVLSFDSDSNANQAHFRWQFGIPFDSGAAMTLVLKARGDGANGALAWMVDFQKGYRGQLEIRNGQARLQNGTSTIGTVSLTASVMHTYMISYEMLSAGLRINVYIDGAPTAVLSGTVTLASGESYIRLGDMSNTNTYKGSLDWIMLTTDGAFFPGGVDLPEGFSLIP
jgi:hypothetical protein